jgi:predicted metal-dependent HD superfamily phosphohydrolase
VIDELKALAPVDAPWAALEQAYATPPRAYHTLEHVLDVARHWATQTWRQPKETFLAVLFHDAVYVAGKSDNEEKSAQLFESLCGKNERVTELIRLTALHGKTPPVDEEAATFLDCDMAILGAPPEAFARYEQQIAQEYVPVIGEEAYALGRRRFLEGLLKRDRIFLSPAFHVRFDAQARANLRAALAAPHPYEGRGSR